LAQGGKAWETVVRTGIRRNGRVAVHERFDEQTMVIVKPPFGLVDGSPISAVPTTLSVAPEPPVQAPAAAVPSTER
jgi:hypothetical protein